MPKLRAFGEKESVLRQPSSAPPQPLGRLLARALRALSEFSFFCLHRVLFRLQSIDYEWFVCEGVTVQTCVKILCNDLFHSVLRVKARGCAFRLAAFTLRASASRGNLLRRFCRMPHCSQAASR